jgi:hypothetical protein
MRAKVSQVSKSRPGAPSCPVVQVDLNALLSGYIDSGLFLVWKPSQAVVGSEKREFEEKKF